jgi:dienelactone hydrolase
MLFKKYSVRRFLITTYAVVATCSPAFSQDIELSWDKGLAYVPGEFLSKSPKSLAIENKLPVLIYLHGCAGIHPPHDIAWAKMIAEQGFLVILPDSMARPNRRSNCDPRLKGGTNNFPQAYAYRQQEISYALMQVQKNNWAENNNIFLMGHSEGGIATALSEHDGVSARVISGWTCTAKNNPKFTGIYSSKNIPVLAVASIDDDWRKGKPNEGRCIDSAPDHQITQVDLSGNEHGTYGSSVARNAVIKFLKENLQK